MEQDKVRGKANSSWAVTRRCLAILLRLQKGPATRSELISACYPNESDKPEKELAVKRLRNDRSRMAKYWGVQTGYSKVEKGYVLQDVDRPLLDLPPVAIETLVFLKHSYQDNVPGSLEINRLVEQLIDWLPADSQRAYQTHLRQRTLTTNQALRDSEKIDLSVEMLIRKAWEERRVVLFEYMARENETEVSKQHAVQPWDLRINKRRRHLELWGYCEWQTTINGIWRYQNYRTYRLGRIVPGSIEIKGKMPGVRPLGKPIRVAYELDPKLLIGGLSSQDELIDEPVLTELESGWWRVEGRTYSVFSLARELLYYGGNCRIVPAEEEGKEDKLLREMKKIVSELHKNHFSAD